ncbi:bifunctional UDP-sugar hydrolase/5'-nucleotidase [Lactobacillus sp. ESL0731]|uniref:bifunctional metallophosphatase/5'-nucleotidase n=1 Tax=unclassified Lactobacillus TaxID=2620435 RepID=UPI0023F6A2B2|nr:MULTISPECIES: bifunctional UDP-sugar hydrolase/5'-nucleotidase [unclassified Lactobacillus]WEV51973.1 bifunctional UDP-sugar hydrolase/5'-nucleotidase [Lactobacillus sp. ESL0700]WEV63104.1 bifunctional UDP-sugar hydrolase/5'-nucleotidase [Lactobacillus sp. ESL0731]
MKLVFLHSSDIHGYLLATDYQTNTDYDAPFGLSRVASVIKAEQAKYGAENVIVTDAGDCLQGAPLASYVHNAGTKEALKQYTDVYNAIGYDARVLGNHDFNYGLDYLKYYIAQNTAPMLNANILNQNTNEPAFGQAYRIIEKHGVKVGLIGITTQYIPHWEPADHVAGLKFTSAFAEVKHYAQILRPQVDVLGVIYHGGFEDDPQTGSEIMPHNGENEGAQILAQIPEVDVFLTGHQHQKMQMVVNQTAIVQPGYRGEAVGKVVLDIDDTTKKITSMSTELITTKDFAADQTVNKLTKALDQKTQSWLDQPIATLSEPAPIGNATKARLEGAPFINLLQAMQLHFTGADISATAVMSETAKGFDKQVTMRDILLNYPYSNQLCKVKLTGRALRHVIEHSLSFLTKDAAGKVTFLPEKRAFLFNFDVFYPVNYEADIARPVGQRLTKLELNGHPIEDEHTYYLAVNNYRVMGGGFYPEYSPDKIEEISDKDYVQMFQEFLTSGQVKVDTQANYHFF